MSCISLSVPHTEEGVRMLETQEWVIIGGK